ncbi:hypothetical protein B0181_09860 [Moraxella caviae]|uniref:Uncharacterized protein n=1 Tax=Moraxella caviae TaxID=34060 RepID=A0A1S9ZXP3_9GAMM|nr:hypothetical protein B0181_09860 [Moraxella caviae]
MASFCSMICDKKWFLAIVERFLRAFVMICSAFCVAFCYNGARWQVKACWRCDRFSCFSCIFVFVCI